MRKMRYLIRLGRRVLLKRRGGRGQGGRRRRGWRLALGLANDLNHRGHGQGRPQPDLELHSQKMEQKQNLPHRVLGDVKDQAYHP